MMTAAGFTLYLLATATLAGAWSNLADLALWLVAGLGMLMMMPAEPNRFGATAPLLFLLGAPWLAGFWR